MKEIMCGGCGSRLLWLDGAGQVGVYIGAALYQQSPREGFVSCGQCGFVVGIRLPLTESDFTEDSEVVTGKHEPNHHEQYIAGVRSWKVNEQGQLTGISFKEPWTKEMSATCTSCRDAPGENHSCGLHAFYDLAHWSAQEDSYFSGDLFHPARIVVGVISASGSAILGEYGFRAQEAKIEALILYKPETKVLGETFSVEPYLRRIANRYDVPLIAPEEVEGFCEIQDLYRIDPQEMIGAESEIEDQAYSGSYSSGLYYSYPGGPMIPVNPVAQPKKTLADIISDTTKKMAEIVDKIDTQPKGGRKPFYEELTQKGKRHNYGGRHG